MVKFSVQSVNSAILEVDTIINNLNQDLQYLGLVISKNRGRMLFHQIGMSVLWLQ